MSIQGLNSAVSANHRVNIEPGELASHHAFLGTLIKEEAEEILRGKDPLPYILWIEKNTHTFFLSFKETFSRMEHRSFSQPSSSQWFYRNGDPHTAAKLADLIPEIMHCQPTISQTITNPTYSAKKI